jgi:hypothetical protein
MAHLPCSTRSNRAARPRVLPAGHGLDRHAGPLELDDQRCRRPRVSQNTARGRCPDQLDDPRPTPSRAASGDRQPRRARARPAREPAAAIDVDDRSGFTSNAKHTGSSAAELRSTSASTALQRDHAAARRRRPVTDTQPLHRERPRVQRPQLVPDMLRRDPDAERRVRLRPRILVGSSSRHLVRQQLAIRRPPQPTTRNTPATDRRPQPTLPDRANATPCSWTV